MTNKKEAKKHQEKEVSKEKETTIEEQPCCCEAMHSDEEGIEENEDAIQKELEEWKDKYLRLSAEFDNYRKRTLKERLEMTKTAGKDIVTNFLPIMDDFERAMVAMESSEDIKAVKEGITLIFSKCLTFLGKQQVKEIEALNEPFDTELHDAVTKIPAPEEAMKGKVIDVIQKGYMMDDKVLRYAKVVIGE